MSGRQMAGLPHFRRTHPDREEDGCVCACMLIYIHTYIHTCIHTYIHTYIRTYIHTYIHTYMHTYTHTNASANLLHGSGFGRVLTSDACRGVQGGRQACIHGHTHGRIPHPLHRTQLHCRLNPPRSPPSFLPGLRLSGCLSVWLSLW